MSNVFSDIDSIVNEVNFKNRPIHISYKYRTIFQVCRLVLIIGKASTKWGCSILKAQVLSSALDNDEVFEHIEQLINSGADGFIRGWRYSKLTSSAINYSNADGITKFTNTGMIVLSDKGKSLFEEIIADDELLSFEKAQLSKIKKKLSDTKLLTILERGN